MQREDLTTVYQGVIVAYIICMYGNGYKSL